MTSEIRLNPATQYGDDSNLRARQRLWALQEPRFDGPALRATVEAILAQEGGDEDVPTG